MLIPTVEKYYNYILFGNYLAYDSVLLSSAELMNY